MSVLDLPVGTQADVDFTDVAVARNRARHHVRQGLDAFAAFLAAVHRGDFRTDYSAVWWHGVAQGRMDLALEELGSVVSALLGTHVGQGLDAFGAFLGAAHRLDFYSAVWWHGVAEARFDLALEGARIRALDKSARLAERDTGAAT